MLVKGTITELDKKLWNNKNLANLKLKDDPKQYTVWEDSFSILKDKNVGDEIEFEATPTKKEGSFTAKAPRPQGKPGALGFKGKSPEEIHQTGITMLMSYSKDLTVALIVQGELKESMAADWCCRTFQQMKEAAGL